MVITRNDSDNWLPRSRSSRNTQQPDRPLANYVFLRNESSALQSALGGMGVTALTGRRTAAANEPTLDNNSCQNTPHIWRVCGLSSRRTACHRHLKVTRLHAQTTHRPSFGDSLPAVAAAAASLQSESPFAILRNPLRVRSLESGEQCAWIGQTDVHRHPRRRRGGAAHHGIIHNGKSDHDGAADQGVLNHLCLEESNGAAAVASIPTLQVHEVAKTERVIRPTRPRASR